MIKRLIYIIKDFFYKGHRCHCPSCIFNKIMNFKGEPMIFYAYAKTEYDMYEMIIRRLKRAGIKSGSITDNNTLEGFLAQCECNQDDIGSSLADKDMQKCEMEYLKYQNK